MASVAELDDESDREDDNDIIDLPNPKSADHSFGELGDVIDLTNNVLLDYLSDTPRISSNPASNRAAQPEALSIANEALLTDADWLV